MIMRLLGSAMPWLLAVLLGVAVFAGMQARQYATERDAAIAEADHAEQRADALGEVMDWQRDQMRSLSTALAAREQLLVDDAEHISNQRDTARQLERDDEATADWADQPVPAAARKWLRELNASAGHDDTDAQRTELPAQAATRAGETGEP